MDLDFSEEQQMLRETIRDWTNKELKPLAAQIDTEHKIPDSVKDGLKELGFYTGLWTEKDLTKTEWEVGTAGVRAQKLDVAWTGPA